MKLIHPILGTPRQWGKPDAIQAAVNAASGGIQPVLPEKITQARLDNHAMGMLLTPMKPDIARMVLENALAGDLFSQWELFSRMEDSWDRLSKNLNEVKNAVKRLNWSVTPYCERGEKPSKTAQEKADLVQAAMKNWAPEPDTLEYSFEDSIYHALDAMGKGVSVQEVQWHFRDGAMLPRAAHIVTPQQYGWNGDGSRLGLISAVNSAKTVRTARVAWAPFTPNQFLVAKWHARSGAPGATALLRPLVPYWIGQTYGWRWLMHTAQLFGVPFRWATYDSSDPGLATTLGTMLENLGNAGWAAFPQGTTLEFKEAVTSARDNPQAVILELSKKACDILILGQELSSESEASGLGSGNAMLQGKVRQDVLHNAAWWIADLLNYQFVSAVLALNYGDTSEAPCIVPDLSVDPDPKTLADRDAILAKLGMQLPVKWMHERHNVPEAEEGEAVLGGQPEPEEEEEDPKAKKETKNQEKKEDKVDAIQARDAALESLIDNTLEGLTGVQARWLGGVKPVFRKLIQAAGDKNVSDEDFLRTVEAAQRHFPELFKELDKEALASALEAAMGAAVVNGAIRGYLDRSRAGTGADKGGAS